MNIHTNWFYRLLHSPFALQCGILSFLIFFLLGFHPPIIPEQENIFVAQNFGLDGVRMMESGFLYNGLDSDILGVQEIITEDEKGKVVKTIIPRRREKTLEYTVKSGDTISSISHRFQLKISTVLWANDMTLSDTLRAGKILKIPPMDGIFYTIKSGDTLSSIAKVYDISSEKIITYNNIKNNVIQKGQVVFLPDAGQIYIAQKPRKTTRRNTTLVSRKYTGGGASLGSIKFIWPTRGVITQGFHRNHYALDIASKRGAPIYAAAGGVVSTSRTGWNYGYGNYIIIDHGGGVQTLYGHNNTLYVKTGESVVKGQKIASMGNTGRVFGPTGIHLHFEIRSGGRKYSPIKYLP